MTNRARTTDQHGRVLVTSPDTAAHTDSEPREFGTGNTSLPAQGLEDYSDIADFKNQESALRGKQMSEFERMVKGLEADPGRIKEDESQFGFHLRARAAESLAQGSGRRAQQGLGGGGVYGIGTQQMRIADQQKKAAIEFGGLERAALERAGKARAEFAGRQVEALTKPGQDMPFVSTELTAIVDRHSRDTMNKATFGGYGKKANPEGARQELRALRSVTDDPLAIQAIDAVLNNLERALG